MNMPRWFLLLALPVLLLSAGCEMPWTSNSDPDEVTFENKSTYAVTVTPQSTGWGGFVLPPGETRKINQPDLYFTYEPRFRVTVGDDTGGRILFINLDEETVEAKPQTGG